MGAALRPSAVGARVYAAGIVASLALLFALDFYAPVFCLAARVLDRRGAVVAVARRRRSTRRPCWSRDSWSWCPPALAMVALQPLEVLLVLAVAWIADTAAYFAGRAWGRHKLAPEISPGKTWEGAAGGLIGAAAYAIILAICSAEDTELPVFVAAAALLVMVSIVGDLFESAAKRQAGVKDSGTLLPGHGGMLDRIDSATATLPVAALMCADQVRQMNLAVLGATGSIGASTLDVVARHPDRYRVFALSGQGSRMRCSSCAAPQAALRRAFGPGCEAAPSRAVCRARRRAPLRRRRAGAIARIRTATP